jgi:hypothetical protein
MIGLTKDLRFSLIINADYFKYKYALSNATMLQCYAALRLSADFHVYFLLFDG